MSKVTKKARIAMIGLGGRGYGLLRLNLVHMKNVEVVGICDVYQDRIDKAIEKVKKVCDINLTYAGYGAICVENSLPG